MLGLQDQRLNLTFKIKPMNHLQTFNYSYEKLEILKILAKFPEDAQKAYELILAGLNEYEIPRIQNILIQFIKDGIWDFEETEEGKMHSDFKIDFHDYILNYPNPIPENIRSGIDTNSILEKLPCSNLNLFEINYISALLKKDAVSQF
ncbi:hypothetical protein APR41_02150 [Salegentibacter salinarum]|uniref:Uncharacterized protein n=2 Tax=Salegentibacter salinarum TaxID=447422 RepID=A0A2N0U473_9FLAO|nr:hypothetical protein APR41_02150 [Salegentibacter salinarum]